MIMQDPNSRYGTFLESYNRGNRFLNNVTQRFIDQISVDNSNIISHDNGMLKSKFTQLASLLKDEQRDSYEKTVITGSILADITPDLLKSADAEVKKSGVNVIRNFLSVAKETEDEQLMAAALKIGQNI